jgi:hypothetical protein
LVVDAPPGHLSRSEIVYQQVCLRHQGIQLSPLVGPGQVERQAALVAIEVEVGPAGFRIGLAVSKRTAPPGRIPLGRFDLDHHSAEIGQHFRGQRRNETFADLHDM